MLFLSWIAFGLVNAFIIAVLDGNKPADFSSAALLSITGTLSGGIFAYLLFSGKTRIHESLPLLLLAVDFILLAFFLRARLFQTRLS